MIEVDKEVGLVETVVNGRPIEICVRVREVSEAAVVSEAEAVVDDPVVLVLPEVVDVDSPLFDVGTMGDLLSTPLEKIRMQARTAMP